MKNYWTGLMRLLWMVYRKTADQVAFYIIVGLLDKLGKAEREILEGLVAKTRATRKWNN